MVFSIIPLRNHKNNKVIKANYWDLTPAITDNTIKKLKKNVGKATLWKNEIGKEDEVIPLFNSWETIFNPSITHLKDNLYLVSYRAFTRNVYNNVWVVLLHKRTHANEEKTRLFISAIRPVFL